VVKRNRTLVLHASYGLTGRAFDPTTDAAPRVYVEKIWGFHLRPAPGGATRLVVRTRGRSGGPPWLMAPVEVLVFEPVHFILQTLQFRHLRVRVRPQGSRRAEGTGGEEAVTSRVSDQTCSTRA
jgi:hypothetical protein